ncbi:hypothetical protein VE02_07416 [Pseudogymnoascus sp. 03VT05]|nr:hypothetical protein VE02_07416 [Pseudogymnoascus sp. 03VT05]
MPPPRSMNSSWESTPTIFQQGDSEKGRDKGGSSSHVDESNQRNANNSVNSLQSSNSKNESDGGAPAELDSEFIVWWDGPDDPENPMNWSSTWKWVNICVISAISFIVPLVSSMMAPGVQLVMEDFNTSSPTFSTFVSIFVLGFACGPLILAPLITFIVLKETYPVVLLEIKASKLRKSTGNPNHKSKLASDLNPRNLFKRSIVRPLKMLVLCPIVTVMCFYVAILYGILYLIFATYSFVFREVYGFTTASTGLVFLAGGLGTLMGLFYVGYFSDRTLIKRAALGKAITPEDRLPFVITIPGFLTFPIGLFIYGWTAQVHVHWIVPQIGTAITGFGSILIFVGIQTYLVDAFEKYAAGVIGANAVLRGTAGALVPLAGLRMYDGLGWGWGNSLLAFVALAFAPMSWQCAANHLPNLIRRSAES